MRRVGILGGTFDPPHNAHVAMATTAMARLPLESVLFMPAPDPPHKSGESVSPYSVRQAMVKLAIDGHAGLQLSSMEEFQRGPSYTAELLRFYKRENDDELFLILGADSVQDLPMWKDPATILELATLIVFPRTGYSPMVPVKGDASVVLFEEPVLDISSTDIRKRFRDGRSAQALVPEAVHKVILDHSLYS